MGGAKHRRVGIYVGGVYPLHCVKMFSFVVMERVYKSDEMGYQDGSGADFTKSED